MRRIIFLLALSVAVIAYSATNSGRIVANVLLDKQAEWLGDSVSPQQSQKTLSVQQFVFSGEKPLLDFLARALAAGYTEINTRTLRKLIVGNQLHHDLIWSAVRKSENSVRDQIILTSASVVEIDSHRVAHIAFTDFATRWARNPMSGKTLEQHEHWPKGAFIDGH